MGAPGDDGTAENSGCVYLYDLGSATPTSPIATLKSQAPTQDQQFGGTLALAGDRLAVGGQANPALNPDGGRVCIYDLAGPTPTIPTYTLGQEIGGSFGFSLALLGTQVVVGAPSGNPAQEPWGGVYLYNLAGPTPTVPTRRWTSPSQTSAQRFGEAVALTGSQVLISDPRENNAHGLAYVYSLSSGNANTPVVTLTNPLTSPSGLFGTALAMANDRAFVGAPNNSVGAQQDGSVYGYQINSGTPDVPVLSLNTPYASNPGDFGGAVALSDTFLVVGDISTQGSASTGSVFVYSVNGVRSVPATSIFNPQSSSVNDNFGYSVAISGTRLVVGAPDAGETSSTGGRAYIYELNSATPAVPIYILNNPSPAAGDLFGVSVAIAGSRVVVGACGDDTGANNSGSAYVYDLTSANPTVPRAILANPNPQADAEFGRSVSAAGLQVVVGAPLDNTGGRCAGSVYAYSVVGGTPTVPTLVFHNPRPTSSQEFGVSVSLSGTRIAVGVPAPMGNDPVGPGVYVFQTDSASPTTPALFLQNPNHDRYEDFGRTVSLADSRLLVGAFDYYTGTPLPERAGRAYLYNLSGAKPTVAIAIFENPDPVPKDSVNNHFGIQVAVLGGKVAVGSPSFGSDSPAGSRAYLFAPSDATPPVFMLPANMVAEATSAVGVSVTYAATATDAESGLENSSFLPASGSLFPIGTTTVRAQATDKSGNTATGSFTIKVVDTTPPVIAGTFTPTRVLVGVPLPDYTGSARATDAVGVVSLVQAPAAGTLLPPGRATVTLTAKDAANNTATKTLEIAIYELPTYSEVALKGADLPGAGVDSRIAPGAKWTSVGIPAVDDAGHVAFLGRWGAARTATSPEQLGLGIFVDGALRVKAGESIEASGAPAGAVWKSFTDPIISGGHVAVIATMSAPGLSGDKNSAVVLFSPTGEAVLVAQEGALDAGSGARFKKLTSVSLVGGMANGEAAALLFTATLATRAAADTGAWYYRQGVLQLVVQEGSSTAPGYRTDEVTKSFTLLGTVAGSPGQGRGLAALGSVIFNETTTLKAKHLLQWTPAGGRQVIASVGGEISGSAGEKWAAFGAVSQTDRIALTASSIAAPVTALPVVGVWAATLQGWERVARSGGPTGIDGVVFQSFQDVVLADGGTLAFQATLRSSGAKSKNDDSLWWRAGQASVATLLAREGEEAVGGGVWKSFTSLAIAGGDGGPLFTATLSRRPPSQDQGLWAADSTGSLSLLLREGDTILDKKVKSFSVLKPVFGSTGATRAFNGQGQVVAQVTFANNLVGIVKVTIP